MHELSLCGAIVDIVNRRAGEAAVDRIHLRIGQLRQVVPETLVYCWSLVTADSWLAGSELVVERVPAQLRCRECQAVTGLAPVPTFACRQCGGLSVEVVAGEEFLVTGLETVRLSP